jgi:hypothetical protein
MERLIRRQKGNKRGEMNISQLIKNHTSVAYYIYGFRSVGEPISESERKLLTRIL